MEFKKINDNTFECRLSKEDLEDFDMSMEDFLKDRDKTIDFMRQIIERSENEIDFEPSSGVMSMQIMPLPGDGLSLTFSNRQPQGDMELISQVRDIIRSHIESMIQSSDMELEDDSSEAGDEPSRVSSVTELGDLMKSLERGKSLKKSDNVNYPQRLFRFSGFSQLERFCKNCSIKKAVKSQVLRQNREEGYLLIVEKGKLSAIDYGKLGESLLEYAEFITDEPVKIMSIREHSDVVIEKNAIALIRDL